MRRLIFAACAWLICIEAAPLKKTANNMHLVVTPAQKIEISPALVRILKRFDITETTKIQPIIASVQNKWLRKSSQERWHMPRINVTDANQLIEDFRELGLVDEICATKKEYEYGVVLGAAVPRIKQRLAYLVRLWNQGIRFKQIVFLTADRPLDPNFEGEKTLFYDMPVELPLTADACLATLPKTETEVLAFFYHNCILPEELKALPLQVVTSKMKNCSLVSRPNTGDTITDWFKYKPRPGSVLAVSNQPFVGYQFSVLRHILPSQFELDVVGAKAPENYNPAIFLDSIARWMFIEVCEFD